jgi:hypothetical protein
MELNPDTNNITEIFTLNLIKPVAGKRNGIQREKY